MVLMKDVQEQSGCLTCKSLQGEITLAPGPVVYEGVYWQIEHVAPTALLGWLVIVLKRHAAALHELSTEEFSELAFLSKTATAILFEKLACEKEYMACFAEGEGFRHVHVHVIPKPLDLPSANVGPQVFQLLGHKATHPVADGEITKLCLELKELFDAELGG